jgi:hypothetical protein
MTPRNRQPNSANDRRDDGRMWLSVAGSRNRNALPGTATEKCHCPHLGDGRTALPNADGRLHFLHGHETANPTDSQDPPERVSRAYLPGLECSEGAVYSGPLPLPF